MSKRSRSAYEITGPNESDDPAMTAEDSIDTEELTGDVAIFAEEDDMAHIVDQVETPATEDQPNTDQPSETPVTPAAEPKPAPWAPVTQAFDDFIERADRLEYLNVKKATAYRGADPTNEKDLRKTRQILLNRPLFRVTDGLIMADPGDGNPGMLYVRKGLLDQLKTVTPERAPSGSKANKIPLNIWLTAVEWALYVGGNDITINKATTAVEIKPTRAARSVKAQPSATPTTPVADLPTIDNDPQLSIHEQLANLAESGVDIGVADGQGSFSDEVAPVDQSLGDMNAAESIDYGTVNYDNASPSN